MDMQKSRHGKKSFIRKSKVSIIPTKESPNKFSFSQIKDSFAPLGKSIDYLSLFLNPQNENAPESKRANEVKAIGEKLVSDELNKLGLSEEENLKNLLDRGKEISFKEEIKESEQCKRHVNYEDNTKSKRRIENEFLAPPNNNAIVTIKRKEEKEYKIELFHILDSLLAPPVIETNIKVVSKREDTKIYVITIGSESISKFL